MFSRKEVSIVDIFMASSSLLVNEEIVLTLLITNGPKGNQVLIPYAQDITADENMTAVLSFRPEGEVLNNLYAPVTENDIRGLVSFFLEELPGVTMCVLNEELGLTNDFVQKPEKYFRGLLNTSQNMVIAIEYTNSSNEQSVAVMVGYHSPDFFEDAQPKFDIISSEVLYDRAESAFEEDDELADGEEDRPTLGKLLNEKLGL